MAGRSMAAAAAANAMRDGGDHLTKAEERAAAELKDKKNKIFQAVIDEDDELVEELTVTEKKEKPIFNDPEQGKKNAIALAWVGFTTPFYHIAYGRFADIFDAFIITVIIIAGTMVGLQTGKKYSCPSIWRQSLKSDWVETDCPGKCIQWEEYCKEEGDNIFGGDGLIDQCVKWIFVAEMGIKILAQGTAPYRYWCGHEDWRWNNFDFCIVMMSFEQIAALIDGFPVAVLRLSVWHVS